MKREDAHQLIKLLGTKPYDRGPWVMSNCPFAEWRHEMGTDKNPSFGIVTGEARTSYFNCFSCKTKGPAAKIPTLLMQFDPEGDYEQLRQHVSDTETFIHSEEGNDDFEIDYAPALGERHLKGFKAITLAILRGRGITKASGRQYELCYHHGEDRLIFPVRDENGRLVALRGRYLGASERAKYKEYTDLSPSGRACKAFGVWYGGNLPFNEERAGILVEGEIDAILLKQEYPNANVLASMGATLTNLQLRNLARCVKGLVCFFDNDKAGRDAKDKVAKVYRADRPVYKVTKYFGCKDPGEILEKGKLKEAMASLDKA